MALSVGLAESEFEMLGLAAGATFVKLREAGKTTEQATEDTKKAMLAAVGQSTLGSIDVAAMSKIGPKLLGVAGSLGGDAQTNISRTVSLANVVAPSTGSAENAATAVEAIARDASGKSKLFTRNKIATRDENGNTRDLQDIIIESAIKTGGSQDKMNSLFGEEARRGVGGFFKQVRELKSQGKSDTQIEEILRAPLETLNNASLTEAKAKELAANMAKSDGARLSATFNTLKNRLGESLLPALMDLVPELQKMIPHVVDLTKYFARFVSWFAQNPFSGLGALVLASIAKDLAAAGIGKAVGSTLNTILSNGGAGGPGAVGAAGAGKLATAQTALFAASVGIAIGTAAGIALGEAWDASQREATEGNIKGMNALGGTDIEAKKKALAELDKNIASQIDDKHGFSGILQSATGAAVNFFRSDDNQLVSEQDQNLKGTLETRKELQDQIFKLQAEELEAKIASVKAQREHTTAVQKETKKLQNSSTKPPGSGSF